MKTEIGKIIGVRIKSHLTFLFDLIKITVFKGLKIKAVNVDNLIIKVQLIWQEEGPVM